MAVRMPRYAAGTMTVAIVFHLLAPRAMAASRKGFGTLRRNSSVLRRVMGIIIRPRESAGERGVLPERVNDQAVSKNADDDGGHAVEQVRGITDNKSDGA